MPSSSNTTHELEGGLTSYDGPPHILRRRLIIASSGWLDDQRIWIVQILENCKLKEQHKCACGLLNNYNIIIITGELTYSAIFRLRLLRRAQMQYTCNVINMPDCIAERYNKKNQLKQGLRFPLPHCRTLP